MVINGWTVLAHPHFLEQFEKLITAVEALQSKSPSDFEKSANAKLLAALHKLVTDMVPSDPIAAGYRQGSTLGDDGKHNLHVGEQSAVTSAILTRLGTVGMIFAAIILSLAWSWQVVRQKDS